MGRFAPSPTGDLHLGSLYTAAASYLDARAHGGSWLVRIEDLDRPRVLPGADSRILNTLELFGFEWDGAVERQSAHTARYDAALSTLRARDLLFECSCSRSELADAERYPGHCRERPLRSSGTTATRLRVEPGVIQFTDRIQGIFRQDLDRQVGDFVVRRRDGLFAYVLAVVVDDAAQHVTDVVRGADLLDNTPRQIYLQRQLHLPTPRYAHVPVLTESDGQKLAKSARSIGLDAVGCRPLVLRVFTLLGLPVEQNLLDASLPELWRWAIEHWRLERVSRRLTVAI